MIRKLIIHLLIVIYAKKESHLIEKDEILFL